MEKSITAKDVANLMMLLKITRLQGNPTHTDSHIDIAGYTIYSRLIDGGVECY